MMIFVKISQLLSIYYKNYSAYVCLRNSSVLQTTSHNLITVPSATQSVKGKKIGQNSRFLINGAKNGILYYLCFSEEGESQQRPAESRCYIFNFFCHRNFLLKVEKNYLFKASS